MPAGYQLFAQVRLAGLVQVKPQARRDKSHWYRIQAKCVDFVLCDAQTTAPRLVIELDDASHNRADRQARDAFVDDVPLPPASPFCTSAGSAAMLPMCSLRR
jgi:very-short-patch-repair endonuclease